MDQLIEDLSRNQEDGSAREDLTQICNFIMRDMQGWILWPWKLWPTTPNGTADWMNESAPHRGEILSRVVIASVQLDDRTMLQAAYPLCQGTVLLQMFRFVGVAIMRYNLPSFLEKYKSTFLLLWVFHC